MREQPIFKHLDLPTQHTNPELDYIVPPARDPDEIALRQSKPAGWLVAREQYKGVQISTKILDHEFKDLESRRFAARYVGATAVNVSHESFAKNAHLLPPHFGPVQRRVLKLPPVLYPPEWRPNAQEMQRETAGLFTEATPLALKVMKCIEFSSPRTMNAKTSFGRVIGKAGIYAACIERADELVGAPITQANVSSIYRQIGLGALNDARYLSNIVGSNVTLAQLAEPDSDLSVYWRREAPNEAFQAFNQAQEEILASA